MAASAVGARQARALALAPSPSARVVSAGSYFTMAINAHGQLVWWGGDPLGAQQLAAKRTAAVADAADDDAPPAQQRTVATDQALHTLWIPRTGRVVQVSAGGRHGALLLDTGAVFTFGENAHGQLGTGDRLPVTSPRAVETLRAARLRCHEVAAGRLHTLAIDEEGLVLAWGCGRHGALGQRSLDDALAPVRVEHLGVAAGVKVSGRVVTLAASDHCLAVTESGAVYAWGLGHSGQLGCGDERSHRRPRRIEALKHVFVVGVSAGHAHSLVLTSSGDAFAFGRGTSGQLGRAGMGSSSLPVMVELSLGVQVAQVAAGGDHSLLLTTEGVVCTCGSGAFGVLGQGGTAPSETARPILIGFGLESAAAVSAGFLHSVLVTAVRQTFTFGSNASLQLGETMHAYSSIPRLVYGLLAAEPETRTRAVERPAAREERTERSPLASARSAQAAVSALFASVRGGVGGRRGSGALRPAA
ncbi:hypothetical protein KFE25_011617 [Diacronema lutheri]|uniref:Uncharacterized protein n=2 Tax=Diacronema lutheri TaxID=2081491 RepID=A0A8J5XJ10_DIALT|nr:hypothetical protein KFE25_011617 [Diacronema lutheri]